jgi:plasmid maintenance system antidote protein VapI
MPEVVVDLVSAQRRQIGFRTYIELRYHAKSIPEFAKELAIDAERVDELIAGADHIRAEEIEAALKKLDRSVEWALAGPAVGTRFDVAAGLSLFHRELVAWRLYLHLRGKPRSREELARSAGVDRKTVERILTVKTVSDETTSRVVRAAGLDLGTLVRLPLENPIPLTGGGAAAPLPTDLPVAPLAWPQPIAPPGKPIDAAKPMRADSARFWKRHALLFPAVGVMALVSGYFGVIHRPEPAYLITLHAPLRVTANEAAVFGEFHPATADSAVVIYVRPASNNIYYRQSGEMVIDENRFQADIRFGDEQMSEPTLQFRVVAALVDAPHAEALPGTFGDPAVEAASEEEFGRRLAKVAKAVSSVARVLRVGATPVRERVRVLQPKQDARVASPFLIAWEPSDQPLYLELRTGGREMAPASGPDRRSGVVVELPLGHYELKLRRSPHDPVLAATAFDVVSAVEAAAPGMGARGETLPLADSQRTFTLDLLTHPRAVNSVLAPNGPRNGDSRTSPGRSATCRPLGRGRTGQHVQWHTQLSD